MIGARMSRMLNTVLVIRRANAQSSVLTVTISSVSISPSAVGIDLPRYRRAAEVWASGSEEKQALRRAFEIYAVGPSARRPGEGPVRSAAKKASAIAAKKRSPSVVISDPLTAQDSWAVAIRKELYKALCKGASKYKKAVAELSRNSQFLITLIATAVAGKIGFAVPVVSALVASVLTFIIRIGFNVFCARAQNF